MTTRHTVTLVLNTLVVGKVRNATLEKRGVYSSKQYRNRLLEGCCVLARIMVRKERYGVQGCHAGGSLNTCHVLYAGEARIP